MLISYNWLQTYFKKKLPAPEKMAEVLTFSAFEIENVKKKDGDFVLDVKVLPDRACYALSHQGIAGEFAAAVGEEIVPPTYEVLPVAKLAPLSINIENSADCRRYIGRRVSFRRIRFSRNGRVKFLEAICQRSINPIVDAANFAMFDIGQPLHVFDADKVKGGIMVRRAKVGERITTLDNKSVELDSETLVIADEEGPLAVAGIKGGKRAEVTEQTQSIILESANFNPKLIRRTSERLGIRTDASKRFENNPSADFAEKGMAEFSGLLKEMMPDAKFGETVDVYPSPEKARTISASVAAISSALGAAISSEEIIGFLNRLGIGARESKGKFALAIPLARRDISIPEDIVEEVGRLYGYHKVNAELRVKNEELGGKKEKKSVHKNFYYEDKVRKFLVSRGFSEVLTSSFASGGEARVLKPVDSTKSYFRSELSSALKRALDKNVLNADLLELDKIKIFELGKVFSGGREFTSLCVGVAAVGKKKGDKVNDSIRDIRGELLTELGGSTSVVCAEDGGVLLLCNKPIGTINKIGGVMEVNLDEIVAALIEPPAAGFSTRSDLVIQGRTLLYKPFSVFPFIARDIAFFVTEGVREAEAWKRLADLIKKHAGELLVAGPRLFDQFKKGDRQSFAYRIVFQAFDRTLTDEEVNKIIEKAAVAISKLGWAVR